jgi:3-(3-hydroxy-phenyl)propionate hydroxylase
MVNLQQYHLEEMLVKRAHSLPLIDLRWHNKVLAVTPDESGATLDIETPEGRYTLRTDWLIVADGARSPIRRALGLDTLGRVFQDRFLIADVLLSQEPFAADATERRFWFDPPFHRNQSALLHREADQVWRMDFQLGWPTEKDSDPEIEKQPERVAPRIRAALDSQGLAGVDFELEWVSVYTFQCRRMAKFRHGRLLFVGDAAHQVSPFGARGANSGVQDTDNLLWKLDLVLRGQASESLLDSYCAERGAAADENLLNSTRSTDFMTPKSRASRVMRDAVLTLAAEQPFARALVNSGRLSVPATLSASALNTPDVDAFAGWMVPGAPADDARISNRRWLLDLLPPDFTLLLFFDPHADPAVMELWQPLIEALAQGEHSACTLLVPCEGPAAQRYDARPGTAFLLRPDQHVAARWRGLDLDAVRAAVARASGTPIAS